ncbi:hypothetical protein D9M71_582850 [compost metagenome]
MLGGSLGSLRLGHRYARRVITTSACASMAWESSTCAARDTLSRPNCSSWRADPSDFGSAMSMPLALNTKVRKSSVTHVWSSNPWHSRIGSAHPALVISRVWSRICSADPEQ